MEAGIFLHPCEGEAVCKLTNEKVSHLREQLLQIHCFNGSLVCCETGGSVCILVQVPYFNAPMFLQNKTQIGKIEEIFGAINDGVCPSHAPTLCSTATQSCGAPPCVVCCNIFAASPAPKKCNSLSRLHV